MGFRVGRLYACTNWGTVWVTFRVSNRLRKVVQLHASFRVINCWLYRKTTRREYREKKKESYMT